LAWRSRIKPLIALASLVPAAIVASPALGAAPASAIPAIAAPSAFARESAMNAHELIDRWSPFLKDASRRFAIPEAWLRAVMTVESGGRTMLGESQPMTSSAGAMGLMQIMPQTWGTMRQQYGLGGDPYDPHDNILAGTAYLALLYRQYGYPAMFAAYNDGPGGLDGHQRLGEDVPPETTDYVLDIASILRTGVRRPPDAAGNLDWLLRPEQSDARGDRVTIMPAPVPPRREYPPDDDDGGDN
jgi:soluble lytic murein transglycosylase-like protein